MCTCMWVFVHVYAWMPEDKLRCFVFQGLLTSSTLLLSEIMSTWFQNFYVRKPP